MSDQRQDAREKMDDLEVRGDEAREVAGGRKKIKGQAAKKGTAGKSDYRMRATKRSGDV
jgi:hypothetical protein